MRRRNHAMALIAALWLLAILMVLVSSFAIAVRTDTVLADSYVRRSQAAWLAEAGMQRAFVELRDSPDRFTALIDETSARPLVLQLDSSEDDSLGLQAGRFLVSGFDEAARLNLNAVDEDTLRRLFPTESELVDAILDWRDDDEETREEGAESDYYASLEDPYLSRDNWFETVSEMLLLRDVDAARFFGENGLSPLANESQTGTTDVNQTALADLFTVDSSDQNVDLSGNERVDVTTASRDDLLEAFPDDLSESEVSAILTYRDGATGQQGEGQGQGQGQGPGQDQAAGAALPAVDGVTLPVVPETADTTEQTGEGGPGGEAETARPATVADLLDVLERETLQKIYDRLTVSKNQRMLGLVNINTASAEVLAALPGMDEALADVIVQARQQSPFESVGDLLGLSEITDEVFKELAPLVTTRAVAYRLEADGTVGEGDQAVTDRIIAIVLLELQPPSSADGTTEATETSEDAVPTRSLRLVYRRME